MILERITFLLEHLARHAAFNSHCNEKLCEKVNHLARSVGEPNGRVTFGGCVELDPKEARRAFEGLGHHAEAQAVRMGFEFSQNLYLSVLPKDNEGLKKAFEEAPLKELEKAFDSYKKLNELVLEAEDQSKLMLENAEKVAAALDINVQQLVQDATKAQQKKLDAEYEHARKARKKIDAASKRVEDALKLAESLRAEASNIVAANKPASRRIATIKS